MQKIKRLSLMLNMLLLGSCLDANQIQDVTHTTSDTFSFSKTWQLGGNLIVQFKSNTYFDFTKENNAHLAAHLPGFQEIDSLEHEPDLIIQHTYCASCEIQLMQEDGKIFIQAPWQKCIPADFIHFLYGACRLEWIRRGIFPVHAACIGNDTQGYVLLLGPPGSGKTSLTLYNALHNNLKIFSGDKTLITFNNEGQIEALAGTKTLTLRTEDISRWSHVEKIDENVWGNRHTFQLPLNTYCLKSRASIKQMYFISVKDEALQSSQLPPLRALHRLYPFFLDKQREDVLIDGHHNILDGFVTIGIKKKLVHDLHNALEHVNVYNLAGSLQSISNFIHIKSGYPGANQIPAHPKKILFGICGIGNGHLNRQLPIILSLLQQGHKIMIFTYGEGLTFFENKLPDLSNVTLVHVENPYLVGTPEGIDFEQTAHKEKNNIDFNRINSLALHKATQEFGIPDLVISDYEMVAAQYAYARQAPLITLDQQSKFLISDFISDLHGTSYKDEIERLSMFFPKATKRIAISFFNIPNCRSKNDMIVEIHPPILRPEIIAAKGTLSSKDPFILVYVTAQQLGDQPIDTWIQTIQNALPDYMDAHIFLPKRLMLPKDKSNLHFYHHGDNQFDSLLFACHGIITTAGHTLLSEAMYLEKPVYALPLPLYEQQLNAFIINEGGFGIGQQDLVEADLRTFIKNLPLYKKNIHDDEKFLLKGIGNDTIIKEIHTLLS